jgi:serine/threonine protein kinase
VDVNAVLALIVEAEILNAEEAETWRAWAEEQGTLADGNGLVDALLERKVLSGFQADALRQGIRGPYRFGPYRVFDRVAVGRLGTIFRAVHDEFRQPVGLKLFPPEVGADPEQAMRLGREMRIAVQVDHPALVRTFQVGRVGDVVFMAIEDLHGTVLADWLQEGEALEPLDACRVVRDVALGLAHLHALGVVHRDVEPANIWLLPDGSAKLMEFGAARDALAGELDDDGGAGEFTVMRAELLGSSDYSSAEQAADEHTADARSDIYSLGCVLFRCLAGRVVFPDRNPIRKMARHASEPVPHVSDLDPQIPRKVGDVAATMLAKDPDQRFQKAEDVAWALENAIEVAERRAAVAADISADYLAWAAACRDVEESDALPAVYANPELIEFVEWLARHDKGE